VERFRRDVTSWVEHECHSVTPGRVGHLQRNSHISNAANITLECLKARFPAAHHNTHLQLVPASTNVEQTAEGATTKDTNNRRHQRELVCNNNHTKYF
jgi:hypothetical protein